jgi:hypothetical protein
MGQAALLTRTGEGKGELPGFAYPSLDMRYAVGGEEAEGVRGVGVKR